MFPLAELHALRQAPPRPQDLHAHRAREILRAADEERRSAARARRRALARNLSRLLREPLRLLRRGSV